MNRMSKNLLFGVCLLVSTFGVARAGTATSVNGLYYTGTNNSGGLLSGGSQDSHWSVTYATANGVTDNSTYQGNAYVVSSNYIDGGWAPNTTTARWIVPPGARTAATGGTSNTGGDFLPGNGTTGTNTASYVYTLAFTIAGTGTGVATNQISITLTLAADDQASIYVNPTLNANGSVNSSSRLGSSITSAWNNTRSITLQNYDDGTHADNASFVIGTNYLVIQVDNTNSLIGSSSATALNPSGLLVYQVGTATLVSGKPIPEVGAWLPLLGALGLFCWRRFRLSKLSSIA